MKAEVILADGSVGRGAAPSGAPTGEFEALELRDGDKGRYLGKGVTKAVENVNRIIGEAVKGLEASDIYAVDRVMMEADGTLILLPAWNGSIGYSSGRNSRDHWVWFHWLYHAAAVPAGFGGYYRCD